MSSRHTSSGYRQALPPPWHSPTSRAGSLVTPAWRQRPAPSAVQRSSGRAPDRTAAPRPPMRWPALGRRGWASRWVPAARHRRPLGPAASIAAWMSAPTLTVRPVQAGGAGRALTVGLGPGVGHRHLVGRRIAAAAGDDQYHRRRGNHLPKSEPHARHAVLPPEFATVRTSRMTDRLLIVAWHNVERTWNYPAAPGAGAAGFEHQLRRLQRLGTIVPLAPSLRQLTTGQPLPPRAIALTFDDGYRDNLEVGAPVLERLGLPATFFLVPGILDGTVSPWWETVAWAMGNAARTSLDWRGPEPCRSAAGPAGGPWSWSPSASRSRTRRAGGGPWPSCWSGWSRPGSRATGGCSWTGTGPGSCWPGASRSGPTRWTTPSWPGRRPRPSSPTWSSRGAGSRTSWTRPSRCSPIPTAAGPTTTPPPSTRPGGPATATA